MVSDGFNINLKLDIETGFIIGGNWRNCIINNFIIFRSYMDG
jgi:hypothetical protein